MLWTGYDWLVISKESNIIYNILRINKIFCIFFVINTVIVHSSNAFFKGKKTFVDFSPFESPLSVIRLRVLSSFAPLRKNKSAFSWNFCLLLSPLRSISPNHCFQTSKSPKFLSSKNFFHDNLKNDANGVASRRSVIGYSCMSSSNTVSIIYDAEHLLRGSRWSFT